MKKQKEILDYTENFYIMFAKNIDSKQINQLNF